MNKSVIRIATRNSQLALWQANFVKDKLEQAHTEISVELIEVKTQGDKLLDTPLAKIGGKGLFTKELEVAMLDDRADIAVHSAKDMPVDLPEGMCIGAICERHDPSDAFVSNQYSSLESLPDGAVVGTSSLRRQCQLLANFPHLMVKTLRGNVNTRLRKLDEGEYDAIILATAGLQRLNMSARIKNYLDVEQWLPAAGQGAVLIEARANDAIVEAYLAPLQHNETSLCVRAERAMNKRLQGGCQVPIAGYATIASDKLMLRALVGRPDGKQVIRAEAQGLLGSPEALGEDVAEQLLDQGAGKILAEVYKNDAAT